MTLSRRRRATLRAAVETFAPPDARLERVTALATQAIEGLSPRRHGEFAQLLDLLALPMTAPLGVRERTLRAFAHSPLSKLRSGFAALKRLCVFLAYAESEPGSDNPTWARIGYPGPRNDRPELLDGGPALSFARDGETVDADVVVVGSGAGGGVAAARFARAGRRVVVLEAGAAFSAATFTQRETSLADLYLEGGLASSEDVGVIVLAGATLGGGTAVNWCTSLRLPDAIAAEWAGESGLRELGEELEPHYAALAGELALEPLPPAGHNRNNATILDGARALGLPAAEMPRNAATDCAAGCGYCGFGCAYGKKRSTAALYLPAAVESGGAIYAGARALRIVLAGARAEGVEVEQRAADGSVARFTVRARTVVCAAGTLRTPGLLARSGIAHPLLGKRLFLHPVAGAFALFDEPVDAFAGPMQSAYSDAYAYRAGNYGAKIEAAPTHPGLAALALPWHGRAEHARGMDEMRYGATLIALTRDRDPGSISLDDEATIGYALSPFDAENLHAGLAGLFDIAFAAGARRVESLHNAPLAFERSSWNEAARAEVRRRLRRDGTQANRQPLFSAHQMGTAPLGTDPARSVVDPVGRVWGYDNLLVTDGSVFPQASGVNPMLTIMAMARRIADAHAA
jgi:choline dehydrogenase-like flavoprotein